MTKGREGRGKLPPFTALFRHTTKSDAWKALPAGAKALFVALQSLHNDRAQNAVWISGRDAIEKYGLGGNRNAIKVWYSELEHYGFIVMVQGACLGAEGKGKAARYRLTDRYHAGKPPTYDFKSWDGVLFDPPKRVDKRGISRLLKHLEKQNPGTTPQPPRHHTTAIGADDQMAENANKWLHTTAIGKDADCPHTTAISTSPSTKPSPRPGKRKPDLKLVWTPPTLVEVEYTDDLRRLYREVLAEDGAAA
jgi:hypothetical protein